MTVFLSKQVLTTVAGREMLRRSKFLEPIYTSKVDLVLHETPPGAKRPLRMASAFLGKYTVVDLIQRKKLDSRNFYESNLTEARSVSFRSCAFFDPLIQFAVRRWP